MSIHSIRDGAAYYKRALRLAEAEVLAEPVLWRHHDTTLTAMAAWLLTRAGASGAELGAWMMSTPSICTRIVADFDARLAGGSDMARKARRRMETLAERMGVIVPAGLASDGVAVRVTCEIIQFPMVYRRRVAVRELSA